MPDTRMTSIVNRARESPWPAVSMDEADKCIQSVARQMSMEKVEVNDQILGRILAETIYSDVSRPEVATSIKDGYAVRSEDGMMNRRVLDVALAGSLSRIPLESGDCIRVSTGAVIPDGADAVVQVEDTGLVAANGEYELEISVKVAVQPGQDIRSPGSEVNKGDILLCPGTAIGSAEHGLLVAFGLTHVAVFQKPTVAILSSGNELVTEPTEHLPVGMVRDSNSPQLASLLYEYGFETEKLGVVHDEPDTIEKTLRQCKSDIIVTTGGVSMGEKDYMKHVLQDRLGFQILFGRVWMKPGLPCTLAHGRIDGKARIILALPGNPVSAWVCAHLFVLPLLRTMSGSSNPYPQKIPVQLAADVKLGPRPEYCRAWLDYEDDEDLPYAHITGNQISSRLHSLVGAQVLLILPSNEKKKVLAKKEKVFALGIGACL